MSKKFFQIVPKYVWLGTRYTYSNANCTFGGIATMWNPDKAVGADIFVSTHFIATNFTTQIDSWTVFYCYAPNTHNGRLVVQNEATTMADSMPQGNIVCMGDFNTLVYPSKKMRQILTSKVLLSLSLTIDQEKT